MFINWTKEWTHCDILVLKGVGLPTTGFRNACLIAVAKYLTGATQGRVGLSSSLFEGKVHHDGEAQSLTCIDHGDCSVPGINFGFAKSCAVRSQMESRLLRVD